MLKNPKGQADRLGGSFLGEPFLLAQRLDIHDCLHTNLG